MFSFATLNALVNVLKCSSRGEYVNYQFYNEFPSNPVDTYTDSR